MIRRIAVFAYGVICYLFFFGTFLYAVGFLGNLVVPKSIDSGPTVPIGTALLINAGLLAVFAIQHSVMARQWFKRAWTRVVPEPIERSTYVLFSSLALMLLFWQWQPMGGIVWDLQDSLARDAMLGIFAIGLILVLLSTFLINHFDLFGLRQVYLYLRGKECKPLKFGTPGPYRQVRHPLYLGWLLTFWATPTMTVAHLVFAVATTCYILIAIQFEERDLVRSHGEAYRRYRKEVPMIIPVRIGRRQTESSQANG